MANTNYSEKARHPVCVWGTDESSGRHPACVFPALCLLYVWSSFSLQKLNYFSPQKLSYFSPLTWRRTKQKSIYRTAAVGPQQPIPATVPGACSKVKSLRHPQSQPRHRCSCGINHGPVAASLSSRLSFYPNQSCQSEREPETCSKELGNEITFPTLPNGPFTFNYGN